MRRWVYCLVLAIVAVGSASPAAAAFDPGCPPGGCVFDPENGQPGYGFYDFDFTVPPDGRTYRWTIDYTSGDPDALVSLDAPNQTEIFYTVRDGTGFTDEYDPNPPYIFDQFVVPRRTTIIVQAPRAFDFCSLAVADGTRCAAVVHIWGNGTYLRGPENAAFTATFTETAIPEPATWVMLVAGFGLVGSGLRRSQVRAAALR